MKSLPETPKNRITIMVAGFVTALASIFVMLLLWEDRWPGLAHLFPDAATQKFWLLVVWAIGFVSFLVAIAIALSMGEEPSRQKSR